MKKSFAFGIIFGIALCACVAFTPVFNEKYYGLDAVSYDGKLLGPTAAGDLSLELCKPDALVKGKCIVMLEAAFYSMKKDYLDTQQKLYECQNQ